MVKEITKNNEKYFMCKACNMYYKEKELAKKCEKHCNDKKSCNLDIIKYAVQID
jgi:methionyl-tRNA synthetase